MNDVIIFTLDSGLFAICIIFFIWICALYCTEITVNELNWFTGEPKGERRQWALRDRII